MTNQTCIWLIVGISLLTLTSPVPCVCLKYGKTMKRFFVCIVILCAGLTHYAQAAETDSSLTQTLVLRPVQVPALRINFDYAFHNALPPFEKEPVFQDKEIFRGLIPTVPPTEFIRNIADKELYLNINHNQNFVTGPVDTYSHTYDPVGHVIFHDLRVSTIDGSLVIPYKVDMFTYGGVCKGWFLVKSGWESEFELDGQKWVFGIVDNLDGRIDSKDHLFIKDRRQGKAVSLINNCPVPQTLSFTGHTFRLEFTFKQVSTDVVLEVVLTEIRPPMGKLNVETEQCQLLCLRNEHEVVLLTSPAGIVSLPAGDYRVNNCIPACEPGRFRRFKFLSYDQHVFIEPGQTSNLRIGPPLKNSVDINRDKNLLSIKYQLVGTGGELYEYYDWDNPPTVSMYKGPFRLARGIMPFG